MTGETNFMRALIVDDEPHIRRLTVLSMAKEGFLCDVAADVEQAEKQLAEHKYDVVVTDLKMPQRNGHALAVGLLERADRPLIVVFTGIAEPKLAKDLMTRGVDDIVFKPVDFPTFAAKVHSLVNRRRATTPQAATPTPA
jgi:DNA-binding response OmpR family regulator